MAVVVARVAVTVVLSVIYVGVVGDWCHRSVGATERPVALTSWCHRRVGAADQLVPLIGIEVRSIYRLCPLCIL